MIEIHIINNSLKCTDGSIIGTEKCRFCVHSHAFSVKGEWKGSPARAFCSKCRFTENYDVSKADAVICDDTESEGFRSIMNVIS